MNHGQSRAAQLPGAGRWNSRLREGCDDQKQPPRESQFYFKRQTSVTVVKDNQSDVGKSRQTFLGPCYLGYKSLCVCLPGDAYAKSFGGTGFIYANKSNSPSRKSCFWNC